MSGTILSMTGPFGASGVMLADGAVKGAAILLLATVAAVALRRRAAAARHFVWLLAVVALLVAPVLSVLLPRWRVLPQWSAVPAEIPVAPKPIPVSAPYERIAERPRDAETSAVEL